MFKLWGPFCKMVTLAPINAYVIYLSLFYYFFNKKSHLKMKFTGSFCPWRNWSILAVSPPTWFSRGHMTGTLNQR